MGHRLGCGTIGTELKQTHGLLGPVIMIFWDDHDEMGNGLMQVGVDPRLPPSVGHASFLAAARLKRSLIAIPRPWLGMGATAIFEP